MLADPGSLGRVADHVLDWEMKEQPPRHKIVARHPPGALATGEGCWCCCKRRVRVHKVAAATAPPGMPLPTLACAAYHRVPSQAPHTRPENPPPCARAEAPAAPPPAAPQAAAEQPHEHSYYLDPHHLQNVDLDPLESDPGDVGRYRGQGGCSCAAGRNACWGVCRVFALTAYRYQIVVIIRALFGFRWVDAALRCAALAWQAPPLRLLTSHSLNGLLTRHCTLPRAG